MASLPPKLKQALAKRAKLVIILAGGFVIVVVIAASLILRFRYQTADRLIDLAPIDSLAYLTVRESVWPEKKMAIVDLSLADYWPLIKQKLNFSDEAVLSELLSKSNRTALVIKANTQNNLDYILIFSLKNVNQAIETGNQKPEISLAGSNNYFVQSNIVVIASSAEALVEEREVIAGKTFSLGSQIDRKKIGQSRLNIYLSGGNLKLYFHQNVDLPTRLFGRLIDRDIFLSAASIGGRWQFEIKGSIAANEKRNFQPAAITVLPEDFELYLAKVNLKSIFNDLAAVDENLADTLRQTIMVGKYYDKEIGNVSAWPAWQHADVVVLNGTSTGPFGFDWILALPSLSDKEVGGLKNLITDWLAVKSSSDRNYPLPDGTTVTEFFAEPQKWQWQSQSWGNNLSADYLAEPAFGLEIALVEYNGTCFMSNSANRLKDYLLTGGMPISSLTSPCGGNTFGKSFLLYSNEAGTGYLPKQMIFAVGVKNAINGCLFKL